ncbi:MAG: choice-of-anchor Q domain-containing protein [Solirubrobacterales bacterium]
MGSVGSSFKKGAVTAGVVASMAIWAGPAFGATIKVDTTQDQFGTGNACSLREAIQSANTDAAYGGCASGQGADTIDLFAGKRYIRFRAGADDANAVGDYDITSQVAIDVKGEGRATVDAGGLNRVIQILPGAKLTASKLTITNGDVAINQPANDTAGGGILNDGTLILSRSQVTKNETLGNAQCTCGGGISVYGTAKLHRVEVIDNRADNIGGGVAWLGGTLVVEKSTIAANTSGYVGGGFYLGANSGHNTAAISDSTISANTELGAGTNAGGGGITVSDFVSSKLTATNVTIAQNRAYGSGGGVYVYAGSIALSYATVARNIADFGGGAGGNGGGLGGGGVNATNSIVALNHDRNTTNTMDDCFLAGAQSSVVGRDTGCTGSPQNRVTHHPDLGPLADNGGPTETIALSKDSPAVDHATKPAPKRDQRGRERDDHPDIGAYERLPTHHSR